MERVDWDCEVVRDFADENLGLKRRIPSGLDRVFSEVEEAIVLEDDCLPHPSFFPYCDELLAALPGRRAGRPHRREPAAAAGHRSARATTSPATCTSGAGRRWRRAWNLYDVRADRLAGVDGGRTRTGCCGPCSRRRTSGGYWGFVWDHVAGDRQLGRPVELCRPQPRPARRQSEPQSDLKYRLRRPMRPTRRRIRSGSRGRPLEGIDFPLEHPAEVSRDADADDLASRLFRRPGPPLWHRVASRLLRRSPLGAGR